MEYRRIGTDVFPDGERKSSCSAARKTGRDVPIQDLKTSPACATFYEKRLLRKLFVENTTVMAAAGPRPTQGWLL